MRLQPFTSLAIASVLSLIPCTLAKACPPLGPVLPPPRAPSDSAAVKKAVEQLNGALHTLSGTLNTTGLSIAVKSLHEKDKLFSYHFTPPQLSGIGTKSINDETIFRVGSLSKVFTALAVLQDASVSMEDSIVKYFPSLGKVNSSDSIDAINWQEITVGSLITHLSGLGRDTAMDLSIFPGPWDALGLPKLDNSPAICSGLSGSPVCTPEDLLSELVHTQPIYKSYTSPSYSNIGFALLGMIAEAVTGMSFEKLVQKNIYDPAGMKSSSFNGSVEAFHTRGFVPVDETTWNYTLGVFESAGGMFSSTTDMLAFGQAVLQNELLSARRTREWLKPSTHTSSLGMSVGAPWEILRSNTLTVDKRVIDVYSKSGDLGLYHAYIGLLPDYDLVFTVFASGLEAQPAVYFSELVKALVPAVDQAAKEEAAAYTGKYTDQKTNSSLVLKISNDPGLTISKLSIRGVDVLSHEPYYSIESAGQPSDSVSKPVKGVTGQMYVTNVDGKLSDGSNTTAWRAVLDNTSNADKKKADEQMFWQDGSCQSWFTLDSAAYGLASVWDFDFVKNSTGAVTSVRSRAFNVTLTKAGNPCK